MQRGGWSSTRIAPAIYCRHVQGSSDFDGSYLRLARRKIYGTTKNNPSSNPTTAPTKSPKLPHAVVSESSKILTALKFLFRLYGSVHTTRTLNLHCPSHTAKPVERAKTPLT